MKKLAYTLHRINGNIEPGQVVEMEEAAYDELKPYGAVRVPTADESALYRMANPVAPSAPAEKSKAPSDRDDLKARAEKFSLAYQSNIKTPKLKELVEAAEAEAELLGD